MPNWIKPFHDSNDQEYHYFSIDEITRDVRITQQSYDAGLALIQSGEARLSKAFFDYDNFYNTHEMTGRLYVSIKPNRSIAVSFTKEMLLDCRCSSYKCRQMHDRSANGICPHEAAALILMTDHLVKNHPGDSTDRTASAFLKQFRRSHRTEKQQKSGTVHLIPRLILDDEDISIRLLISSDSVGKPYVVKNIADLFQDIDAGRVYPLGKNAGINFSEEDFAEDTYAFAQTVRGWLHDKKESRRDRYYYHSDDDLSCISVFTETALTVSLICFWTENLNFISPKHRR